MMFRVASSMYIGIFTLVVLQLLWLIQEGGKTVKLAAGACAIYYLEEIPYRFLFHRGGGGGGGAKFLGGTN